MTPSTSRILIAAWSLAALNAVAAEPSPKSPKFATREEIRGCMNSEEELSVSLKRLDGYISENRLALARMQAEAAEIAENQRRLDTTDEKAVDAFNTKVSDHNKRVQEVNSQAESFKVKGEAHNADSLAHNKRCATLVYRIDDRNAILKERQGKSK